VHHTIYILQVFVIIIILYAVLLFIATVGLFIVKENIWRNFPIKNIRLSQNGSILLNISPEESMTHHLYRRQFKQQSLTTEWLVKARKNRGGEVRIFPIFLYSIESYINST